MILGPVYSSAAGALAHGGWENRTLARVRMMIACQSNLVTVLVDFFRVV